MPNCNICSYPILFPTLQAAVLTLEPGLAHKTCVPRIELRK